MNHTLFWIFLGFLISQIILGSIFIIWETIINWGCERESEGEYPFH
jgi:hypothetical protein